MDTINGYFTFYPYSKPIECLEIEAVLICVKSVWNNLASIINNGYLNNHDLSKYPIISKLIDSFTTNEDYINGEFSHESFKWLYNIINLSIYNALIKYEEVYKEDKKSVDVDKYHDFVQVRKQIYQKLDPSIRKVLQKNGITLVQNLVCGFDTEYVNVNLKFNKLVSIQMAQQLQCYLKLPLPVRYRLCKINPVTEAKYPVKFTKSFDFSLVECLIANHVEDIRTILYGNLDICCSTLIDSVMNDSTLKYQLNNDSVLVKIPNSVKKEYVKIIGNEGYSLDNLLKDSTDLSRNYIYEYRTKIVDRLKTILLYYNDILNKNGAYKIKSLKEPMIKIIEPLDGNNIFSNNLVMSFGDLFKTEFTLKCKDKYTKTDNIQDIKAVSRNYIYITRYNRISISYVFNNVIVGHNTPADFSILNDFEDFKQYLDIVNKCFITLGKGFRFGIYNVVIRDTMLLAPAGQKSLASVGQLYNYEKIKLTDYELSHMDLLLKEDPNKFKEYAIRDSLITLKHAIWMEEFHFSVKGQGIPTTLSSLGNKFVKDYWYNNNYPGYQLESAPEYLIGEASTLQTPLGLSKYGNLGLKLSLYISNYKGGRNESFMYGVDLQRIWFDYDLISAYTTVLSNAGHPDYSNGIILNQDELEYLNPHDLIYSYTIIKCSFKFPASVKYPSIPVYVDESSTVYPSEGIGAILTGAEYYLAKVQGCKFKFEEIYTVPYYYQDDLNSSAVYPFKDIIKEIQLKRREHKKGTISNLMYKEIGNSIYGSVVRGMSDKRRYDNKTGQTIRMKAHYLTNPLIASWVTGFIRSIIGEQLHCIQLLNGTVVSVTTDGYITDIADLEYKILNDPLCKGCNYLIKSFKCLRNDLSNDNTALELKQTSNGIISWTTRGQLGIDSTLKATTGFQNYNYRQTELNYLFSDLLKKQNRDRGIEYIQTSLRSALDIVKRGGHVTRKYRDQKFSLLYDNRREIIDNLVYENVNVNFENNQTNLIDFKDKDKDIIIIKQTKSSEVNNIVDVNVLSSISSNDNDNDNEVFLPLTLNKDDYTLRDSKPLKNSVTCFNIRTIANKFRFNEYNQRTSFSFNKKYKNYTDIAVKSFIKGLLSTPPKYPDISIELNKYDKIIEFVKCFDPKYKISKSSLSNLKNRKLINKQIPKNDDTIRFIEYVKLRYPQFKDKFFFSS